MKIRSKIGNFYIILTLLLIFSINLSSGKSFSEISNSTKDTSNFSTINSQSELPDKEQLITSNKKSEIKYRYINLLLAELNNVKTNEETANSQSKIENIIKDFVNEMEGDKLMETSLLERIRYIQNNRSFSEFKPMSQILTNSTIISLNPVSELQKNDYYCGPAAANNCLKASNIYYKRSNPSIAVSQDNLAQDLGTTTEGTPFDSRWERVMRDWSGIVHVIKWAPSEIELWKYVTSDVQFGYGVIADIHMVAGGYHLPGYDRQKEYWHYIALIGYDPVNHQIYYSDSSKYNNGCKLTDNYSEFVKLCKDRGIVW